MHNHYRPNDDDILEKFPKQLRDHNIIPIKDRNSPKIPGYKWGLYKQKKYPHKKLNRHKGNNAVICGDPLKKGLFLTIADLDEPLFFEYFKSDNTFMVKTPSGGYHIYYFSKKPVKKSKPFKNLPFEILGEGSYCLIPPSSYYDIPYLVIKDKPILTVDNAEVYIKSKFPKQLIQQKISRPKDIKQFKKELHKRVSLEKIVIDHYPNWYEPNPNKGRGNTIRLMNPLSKQKTKNPSFIIFKRTNTWYSHSTDEGGDVIDFILTIKKESRVKYALKYLQKKYKVPAPYYKKSSKSEKTLVDSIDDFLKKTSKPANTLSHGCCITPEEGLIFLSVFNNEVNGIFGVSRKRILRAIKKSNAINEDLHEDLLICEGYVHPLNEKTQRGIRNLLHKKQSNIKSENNSIFTLFQKIHDLMKEKYLELDNEGDYIFLTLWILGTYMRPIFVWYPYITFFGLRDVGKSTALTLLSNLCFNGSGYVSGKSTEASLFRKAASSKGFFPIDHYEEIIKSKNKLQIMNQYLENAWFLNSTIDIVNKETHELEQYKVASSVAIGTREINDVLEEKGIVIEMVETSDTNKRFNSSKMYKDPFFENIQEECMEAALDFQDKIIRAYEDMGDIPGLIGREYNKFIPILAIAKVIDGKNDSYNLFNTMTKYAIDYRLKRKQDLKDTEELLLKIILVNQIKKTTYKDLVDKMKALEEYDWYTWQRASSDLRKLQIITKKENKKPIQVHLDLDRARIRADQRGITYELTDEENKL
ncbi:hypothetical protein FGU46_10335 [Methanobacterium sp. CWC-01]|uniref:hypothetical protein n=1 Tax=Methanobacterium aridiramus TaxID=2584467 RepID=UPI0025750054|nr:hypothetical protein [Methanobacterium sp. CWC-01]WJI10457.1 hypothetical protein FGU46_10335 [Methanobacterium sp. CWC-01]